MRIRLFTAVLVLTACKEEHECFDPVLRVDNVGGIPGERLRIGDVDDDGREDVLGIEDLGDGVWRLHPLLATGEDPPFEIAAPIDVNTGIALDKAFTEFIDANGDGTLDLATFQEGTVVIIDGPLSSPGTPRSTPVGDLSAGRGAFLDFDDDGLTDFVFREGNGDNLVSLRGLSDGGFEPASVAEFHEDSWCINRFVTYEDGDRDWLGVQARWICGNASTNGDARVTLYSIEDDGSFNELGSAQWEIEIFDRTITLHSADNFVGDAAPELLINASIRGPVEGELTELASVPADVRGRYDDDEFADHLAIREAGDGIEIHYGGGLMDEPRTVAWGLGRSPDTLSAIDVNGDGVDELVASEGDVIRLLGPIGTCLDE